MAKKVVLAYSGGLDTSVAVRWMIEHLGCEVICVSANVGQEGTLDGNREKALGAGASEYVELDLREEFARDYLAPVIKANALYENKYPLVSALSQSAQVRPLCACKNCSAAMRRCTACSLRLVMDAHRFSYTTSSVSAEMAS